MSYDFGKNKQEHPDPVKAEVKGSLPEWLQGTLVRNGPGIFSVGETSYNHWFDGMALLYNFTIKQGEVIFRSKYLRSDTYNSNMKANRIVVSEMGTMAYPHPSKNVFTKVITFVNHTIPDFTDNCLGNIIKYGNDYYATSETNYIRKIDPLTLETQDKVDYKKYIGVSLVISHPHYDKEGNTYNMGTSIADKGKSKYVLFKVPPVKQTGPEWSPALTIVEIMCTVPCRSLLTPSYYHSFGMTENYFIFIEQPLKLDILKMATAYLRGVSWSTCLKFQPEDQVVIHLIDRNTRKEVSLKYHTGAMVVYHHVNAFEEDGHVICDVIAYDDYRLYEMFYLDKLKEQSASATNHVQTEARYKRFVLPLTDKDAEVGENLVTLKYTTATSLKEKDGKILCQPETLTQGTEVPRINYNYNGQKHRYVYMNVAKSALATKVIKLDVETKQRVEWSSENCTPTEPVFVPRPGATEEDDGVVLTSVINSNADESDFLLVLDGKSFTELARALQPLWCRLTLRSFSTKTDGEIHIAKTLKEKFPLASALKVVDISGGCGAMYEIHIESEEFKGRRTVQQHQLVNQALKEEIKGMHGLRIFTNVPKQ
ncbi:beta,beta-carotene 15,15'-dioxygenase [Trichomycterus rosablanca]|uniref:beta,beta-carotene 15,15'-dioxygenase n=1 Tax=Trichomycterus rosablanca TaxID=2290929 RepID=UPI002F35460F